MERGIAKTVRGFRAVDGAGVRLVRVLGHDDVYDFDPFLMLDSFDSTDPRDYVAGFPTHPHRGIETVTYLISGRIEHEDSLGYGGVIASGGGQWMTAGGGILHQEMPKPSDRMLGFQLWLNMPRAVKMAPPAYLDIRAEQIPDVREDGATVRVVSGAYRGVQGVTPRHVPATILDVTIESGRSIRLDARAGQTAFLFTIQGGALVSGERVLEKSAVLFGEGDHIMVSAHEGEDARFIFFIAPPLREPIAWGGPIVMNTQAELDTAFRQLREGTFLNASESLTRQR
jgi:redox-sensitive bicupin YhaK (pirin superfamily)